VEEGDVDGMGGGKSFEVDRLEGCHVGTGWVSVGCGCYDDQDVRVIYYRGRNGAGYCLRLLIIMRGINTKE
jgi:hypothetical protein